MVDPTHQVFWFASRAFGIVAMLLLGVSVAVGLAMSGRLAHRPGLPAKLKHFHESATLVTLGLIGSWRTAAIRLLSRPGLAGITLHSRSHTARCSPASESSRAGWQRSSGSASTRAEDRCKTWRFMHRFTIVVYLLALVHVIGSGTDARSPWMIALLTVLTAPIVFAFTYRMLPSSSRRRPAAARGATVERPPASAGIA